MALVEIQPSAHGRARREPRKVASLAPHGGGRAAAPAARGLGRPLARGREKSVWTPIALKALAVLAGMLALAAIGASSIARGSGVPAPPPSAHSAPRQRAAGITPEATRVWFAETEDASSPERVPDAGSHAPAADAGPDAAAAPSDALTADGKVILNRAGVEDLRRIPGIGPKRAQAIVELRTKLGGRFKRLSELLRVKGIGTKSLKKMEPYLVLDAP